MAHKIPTEQHLAALEAATGAHIRGGHYPLPAGEITSRAVLFAAILECKLQNGILYIKK